MTDDSGVLSIDFIVGFTIFLLAFIWVMSLIPGLLINLQGYTIDYDAVAYRTGVILVEDPGEVTSMNFTSPWESQSDKDFVARFGLAISRDTPNILSQEKVDRFFCTTAFIYPNDYREKAIFGDYPYGFKISLRDVERNVTRSIGDVLPGGYGYIRRLVKIKGVSNATINGTAMPSYFKNADQNVTSHTFSILINTPQLYTDMTDLSYQIDPVKDQIMINITDLKSTMSDPNSGINLTSITVASNTVNSLQYSTIPDTTLILDYNNENNKTVFLGNKLPQRVNNSISLTFSPKYFQEQVYPGLYDKTFYKPIYINLSFTLDSNSTFLNNSWSSPFDYNYDPANVTQPKLRDAVLEVAVWSGATTTSGGSPSIAPAHTFTSITLNSGPTTGGTPVTIVGTNFVSGGWFGVTIGGAAATSVVLVDSSHITAVTPAGTLGAKNVVITNNDGQTVTGAGAYTYVPPPAPTFTSITPNSGSTAGGTPVTIVGTNFVSGGSFGVTIGGAAATSVV